VIDFSASRFAILTPVMLFTLLGGLVVLVGLGGVNRANKRAVSLPPITTVGVAVLSIAIAFAWSTTSALSVAGATVKSKSTVNSDGVIVQPITKPVVIETTVPASSTTVGSVNTVRKHVTTTVPRTTSTTIAHVSTPAQIAAAASGWPRPYDPNVPMDFTNVAGVSADQIVHAQQLLSNTQSALTHWASPLTAVREGWRSIGDGGTGFEHYINYSLLNDGKFLDAHFPESLVYSVDETTGARTLVSAMYIAAPGTPLNDSTLVNFAGALIQWHVHNNLCWRMGANGSPIVAGITDAAGNCPTGTAPSNSQTPMVHVWVTANKCGPFAAVEGIAAGVADVPDSQRVDLCNASH
jgi:hypothetical protein